MFWQQIPELLLAPLSLSVLYSVFIHPFWMAKRRWQSTRIVGVSYLITGVFAIGCCIPSCMEYNYRAKQTEARVELKKILNLQKYYFKKTGTYAQDLEELGYVTETENYRRYEYSLAEEGFEDFAAEIPDGGFVAIARSNLDFDSSLDIWMIDHRERLINVYNDYREKHIDPNKILTMSNVEYSRFCRLERIKRALAAFPLYLAFLFYAVEPITNRQKRRRRKPYHRKGEILPHR